MSKRELTSVAVLFELVGVEVDFGIACCFEEFLPKRRSHIVEVIVCIVS